MDNVLGQETTVGYLKSHIKDPPHILLWGPTGVGKTIIEITGITA